MKWVGVALSVVGFVLERVEQVSSNTEDCLKLLKYMCDLAKYIKQLDERLAQEKLNRVLQFIVEGSALCISQIESHSFSRCLVAPVMAEDLQRLQRDLEHEYSDLSLGAIIVVLNSIEEEIIPVLNRIPEVLPPSQGLPPQSVGTEEPSKEVTQLLDMKNKSVIAVVIYGQGGIGKTTLATTVFTKLDLTNYKFSSVDMQQDCTESDLQKLQQQILRDLFQRNIELTNCNKGRDELSKEFKKANAPLFIFVDNALRGNDFDKLLPINALASLPAQSRILLTTRNLNETRLILQAGIERRYYLVPSLPQEKAQKLLCEFALGSVQESFDATIDIGGLLKICGGVPLVLKLAGARLREHSKSVPDCREEVEYLKSWLLQGEELLEMDVSERMVDSVYNRLGESCKEAFLDIVFFFCNWKRRKVACIVGETELQELERAAVVNITDERRVKVHDIVQARGKRLSPHGERIVGTQSVADVLYTEKRFNKIKGITYEGQPEACHLNLMSRCLRVLIMRNTHIVNGECKGAFENLRFLSLDCENYSLMDVSKHPRLAALNVVGSGEFSGVASPSALKYILLVGATLANLSTTFSQLQSLRVLKLWECEGFDSLPESIGNLTSLEKLDLRRCKSLVSFPDSFGNLCSLSYLRLHGCRQLSALPKSFGNLASLELLSLECCWKLSSLPQNFGQLKRLKYLSIYGCSELQSLSADFEGLSSLIAIQASFCDKLEGETIEKVAKMKGLMMVDITRSPQLEERWKQVRDQYSLAVVATRELQGYRFVLDYADIMGRALLQSGSRFMHADENGVQYEECSPPVEEFCVLLTVCDLTWAGNRRYLEEVKKEWEEVGGEKKKVFVDVGVSWEESERRVREMLPLLPSGTRAWIAAESRARLLFAYSLLREATEYQPTVIVGIRAWENRLGRRRMSIDDKFVIPDCKPDFKDVHTFDQLFSPLSKAEAFLRKGRIPF